MIFHKISWKDYHKACIDLAKQVKKLKIDKIIAISRGGLLPARILSDLLTIPISHITIESYQSLKKKKYLTITDVPSISFNGQTILIVDEIADTGRTFKRAISYFKNFRVKKIYTLAPYMKPHTKYVPDFWGKKIDAWIIFPYELKETQQAFLKLFKTKDKARKKLIEVGFLNWELS